MKTSANEKMKGFFSIHLYDTYITNDEKFNAYPLKSRTRQGYPSIYYWVYSYHLYSSLYKDRLMELIKVLLEK